MTCTETAMTTDTINTKPMPGRTEFEVCLFLKKIRSTNNFLDYLYGNKRQRQRQQWMPTNARTNGAQGMTGKFFYFFYWFPNDFLYD